LNALFFSFQRLTGGIKMTVKAIKGSVVDYARDAIAFIAQGALAYNVPLIGGAIGLVLGNYIAPSGHKTAVNVVNTLIYVDSLMEWLVGGRGVM
jgi:hypothetical protein